MKTSHPAYDTALKTGDLAKDFGLADTTGKVWRLSEGVESRPLVLVFYRGDW